MDKIIIIFLCFIWCLSGCKNNNEAHSEVETTNEVQISKNLPLENVVVDSVIVLGRDPWVLYCVSMGREDFIEHTFIESSAESKHHMRFRLINNTDEINDIVQALNELEMVTVDNHDEPSPTDWLYRPIIDGKSLCFMNNDPMDVMILVVLYSNNKCIPVWIDLDFVDIQTKRFSSSKTLMSKLYEILGYKF